MSDAAVPYSLLRTLRACLDGTADQPAWDRAKDELDDLLLAEPGPDFDGPVVAAACSLCEAGHVPLTPCGGSVPAEVGYASIIEDREHGFGAPPLAGPLARMDREISRPGPEGDGDPC